MNFIKYALITLLTLVALGAAGYLLAGSGIKSEPGYVKLSLPAASVSNTTLALDIGPKGVQPLRWLITSAVTASNETLELPEQLALALLEDIQGVQIRIYEVDKNAAIIEQAIDDSVATLQRDNWQTILKVRETDQRIVLMQSETDGVVQGLSLFARNDENAVFVNLMGAIDPQSIATIANGLTTKNLVSQPVTQPH
ncbi:MAG: DUF4252 domain-containing protein [Gammaproteobacteria bacterium]|nr:DUF4252 domain-containing protein [Gammaproteobacteria bacterium]